MDKIKDAEFMRRAIELAWKAKGQTTPNPAVGSVIVKNNKIIAEGYHKKAGMPHAEAEALKKAGAAAKGATLYVTLEPCSHFGKTPPCADAIINAGVKRVVAAHKDPFPLVAGKGFKKLRAAGIEVTTGILENEAKKLNEDFIKFHAENKVFVHLKWAMTLDGRTSTDIGDSKWISNEQSRNYSHTLRSYYDAVLIGSNTLKFDDPELSVRLPGYKGRQPFRIILDDNLDADPKFRIFNSSGGKVIIFTSYKAFKKRKNLISKLNAEVIPVDSDEKGIDIECALEKLKSSGIHSVFVEGGRNVAGSFFEKDLADKITIFIAPKLIGGYENKSPLITLNPSLKISESPVLTKIKYMNFNEDICIEGYPDFTIK